MKHHVPNKKEIEFIRSILAKKAIFSRLNDNERWRMSSIMKIKRFAKNETIIRQNERMSWFGIVWKGELSVNDNKQKLLKYGDCVGQEVFVNADDYLSENTIKCMDNCKIFTMSKSKFSQLFPSRLTFNWKTDTDYHHNHESLDKEDQLPMRCRRSAVSETFSSISFSDQHDRHQPNDKFNRKTKTIELKKTTELSKWLKHCLKKNILCKTLAEPILDAVVSQLYYKEVGKDFELTEQKTMGNTMYILEKGLIYVFVDEKKVSTMAKGDCFGELALMYDCPRAATCKTMTECKLWCIDRNVFKNTLQREARKEMKKLMNILNDVPIIKTLSKKQKYHIAENLNRVYVEKDDIIIKENEKIDDGLFYIIQSGKCVAIKTINNEQQVIKNYGVSEYFGERALIKNEARAATIKAMSYCELLTLRRSEFIRSVTSVHSVRDAIEQKFKYYEDSIMIIASKQQKCSSVFCKLFRPKEHRKHSKEKRKSVKLKRKLKDFRVLHGIGEGSYATVWCVRDSKSMQTFALKKLSKRGVENTQQQEHVANERDILSSVNSIFIIRLFSTFQDKLAVYMVLDLGLGGDMFTYLSKQRRISEDKARFFMGCIVLAFEYLHKHQILYRDLKPENCIFDFRGYLKLIDFGFAKRLNGERARTYTFCGTPVYVAPEIIGGLGHGLPVDWWCSGIFLYEMIRGKTPFERRDTVAKYAAIVSDKPVFSRQYFKSDEVIDLLHGLLKKKPNDRFGHSVVDIHQSIKCHPWFRSLDWEKLEQGNIVSPYKPHLKGDADLKYFDQNIEHRKYDKHKKPKEPNAKWMSGF